MCPVAVRSIEVLSPLQLRLSVVVFTPAEEGFARTFTVQYEFEESERVLQSSEEISKSVALLNAGAEQPVITESPRFWIRNGIAFEVLPTMAKPKFLTSPTFATVLEIPSPSVAV